jgi:7-carboxy-7-deazaguanine synthase
MRIAEIFRSLQGEGRFTGTDSLFVRFSGCNLRCRFCDTRYASWSPEGEDLSLEQVLAQLVGLDPSPDAPVRHAVVTGGEPLLFDEVVPLCRALRGQGRHVTIETAGTRYRPVACDLMSISPKLAHSTPTPRESPAWAVRHESARHVPEAMRRLLAEYDYQLKFVVHRPEDCREVEAYLAEFPQVDRRRVWLMPEGVDVEELAERARWLEPYCAAAGLHFCPRRQIEWFGSRRGV